MPRVPSATLQQLMEEDRRCARYLAGLHKRLLQRLCGHAKAQGVGVDGLEDLTTIVLKELRSDLRGPISKQLLMLDRDDDSGAYSNPRLTDLPAEEAMWPLDDDGEMLDENNSACDVVATLPILAWLPEM